MRSPFQTSSILPWILGGLGVCFLLQVVLQGGLGNGLLSGFNGKTLWAAGSVVPRGITEQGEIWRLYTGTMLHGGLGHFVMNAYALVQLGRLAEALYGPARFGLAYLLSALGGAAASAFWLGLDGDPTAGSIGASGAVCGILGLLIGRLKRDPNPVAEAYLRQLVTWAIMILAFGLLVPGIDNAGHVGGFVTGFALSFLLPLGHFAHLQQGWRRWWAPAAAAALTVVALGSAGYAGLGARGRLEAVDVLPDMEASGRRLAKPLLPEVKRAMRARWRKQEVPAALEPTRKRLLAMIERSLATGAPLPPLDAVTFSREIGEDLLALAPDLFRLRQP